MYWCHSQDRTLRKHFGPGVKFAYGLKFKNNSNQTVHCALLIIAGDVATNPGSMQTTSGPGLNHSQRKSKLSVLFANARSIVNKTDKMYLEIESGSHDIVVLTETHLDDSILGSEIFPSNFIVFRNDRQHLGRYGGGVLIAARNSLKILQREDIICQSELLFLDMILKRDKKLAIGKISSTDTILLSDFNVSEIDWNNIRSLRDATLHNLLKCL